MNISLIIEKPSIIKDTLQTSISIYFISNNSFHSIVLNHPSFHPPPLHLPYPTAHAHLKPTNPNPHPDILLLSAFGYDAYGLDFSSTALTQARENAATIQNSSTPNPVYATRNPAVGRGIVKYIQGDFFKEDFKKEIETKEGENWGGKFDLLYDYTFGCALPPSLRSAWSLSYSKLLSPTGHLICVEFPSAKPENLGGPPWALSAKVHWAHLRRPGEDLGYAYDKYAVKDAAESEERWVLVEQRIKDVEEGKGLMRVEHFKPDVTHNVGYNEKGEVEDMVSVWRQKGAGGDEKL